MENILKSVAVWGDSVLKGVILDEKSRSYRFLSENCIALLVKRLGLSVINKSRFGCTIEKGENLLDSFLETECRCDYALLEFGGNDCDFLWKEISEEPEKEHFPKTQLNHFLSIMTRMIVKLRENKIEPVLMSLPPIDGDRYFRYLVDVCGFHAGNLLKFIREPQMISRFHESYSLAITNLSQKLNCIYIPIREAFLSDFDYPDLICADGIHPNRKGHHLMECVFSAQIDEQKRKTRLH